MSPSESRDWSPSCILYHGPSAQGRAALAATEWGRVVGTFGDPRKGFTVDAIREALEVMQSVPVGDRRSSVVVGPLDLMSRLGVEDGLLKTLEEVDTTVMRPYLWAWDAGSVRSTIRSRCLLEWSPGVITTDPEIEKVAALVVQASLAGEVAGVIESLQEIRSGWKDCSLDFVQASVGVLARMQGTARFSLWHRLRRMLCTGSRWSFDEVLVEFLP